MSLTFTLIGKNSVVSYFLAIDLGDCELDLTDFEMYYSHCNSINNKFYYGNDEIVIPEGSYELCNIERYLKRKILHSHNVTGKKNEDFR